MAQRGAQPFSAQLPTDLWRLVDRSYKWSPDRYTLFALCSQTRDAVLQNIGSEFGFNAEQTKAFVNTVLLGKHVFLTGGAGVGKSHTVRQIAETMRRYLKSMYDEGSNRVAITAPTAAAAKIASTASIVGKTLHLAFNIRNRRRAPTSSPCVSEQGGGRGGSAEQLAVDMGVGDEQLEDADDESGGLPTAVLDQHVCQWLRHLKLLIVDEISMASKEMIDLVDGTLKHARGSRLPFGGCVVLFVGDPLQLAPVCMPAAIKRMDGRTWAFQSDAWQHLLPVQLVHVVRQAGDPHFAAILNRMRFAAHTPQDVAWINTSTRTSRDNALTAIMPSHNKCNQRNGEMLARLVGPEYRLEPERFCREVVSRDPWEAKLLAAHEIPPHVYVRYPSAKSVNDALVLKVGARVRCIRNVYSGTYPRRSLDVANGQLGTVTRIEGLSVAVLFDAIGMEGRIEREVAPVLWARKQRFELNGHPVFACVKQLPLTLSWAQTLHSAQGATIATNVDVDHTAVFPNEARKWVPQPAAAYVALSRPTTVGAMRLLRPLKSSDIVADPEVLAYMTRTFGALQRA